MTGRKDVTTGPMCNYLNEIDLIEYINEPFLRGATQCHMHTAPKLQMRM